LRKQAASNAKVQFLTVVLEPIVLDYGNTSSDPSAQDETTKVVLSSASPPPSPPSSHSPTPTPMSIEEPPLSTVIELSNAETVIGVVVAAELSTKDLISWGGKPPKSSSSSRQRHVPKLNASSPQPRISSADDAKIAQLVSMGFDSNDALKALGSCKGKCRRRH